MADVVDKATRSRMMAGIKGKNTKPEIIVRRALHASGFRFRLHDKKLPGKPDIVLPKYRAVVFVNGCFWHCHTCKNFRLPKSNRVFWREKLAANAERDAKSYRRLKAEKWRVLKVWECQLSPDDRARKTTNAIVAKLKPHHAQIHSRSAN